MRLHRLAIPVAAVGLVAATALTAVGLLSAPDVAGAVPSTSGSAPSGLRKLDIPELHDRDASITLLTGDRVQLKGLDTEHASIVSTPVSSPVVRVQAHETADGIDRLQAEPSAATALVAAGLIDPGALDVLWLAAHGQGVGGSAIDLTIQYPTGTSSADLRADGEALAGARVVDDDASKAQVQVSVEPNQAARFWSDISAPEHEGAKPGMAGDLSSIWVTGHRVGVAQPTAMPDTHQLVEMIRFTKGEVGCSGALVTMCLGFPPVLYGVAGPGTDQQFNAESVSCVDQDPCTTFRLVYRVPNGIYSSEGGASFGQGERDQLLGLIVPEIRVAGDTEFTLDADTAQKVDYRLPKPTRSEVASEFVVERRTTSGNGVASFYSGYSDDWLTPTDRVRTGTFHVDLTTVRDQAQLAMQVHSPKPMTLHPWYFIGMSARTMGQRNDGAVQFDMRKRVQVVDVGYGRPEDYANVDARGKLALIQIGPDGRCAPGSAGYVTDEQLHAAIDAGAVGVLVDPRTPAVFPNGWCAWVGPEWRFYEKPIPMPFATISIPEAKALHADLDRGPVTIDVDGTDRDPAYFYTLRAFYEGQIPTSLTQRLTSDQLQASSMRTHVRDSNSTAVSEAAWGWDEYAGSSVGYFGLGAPGASVEYRGPVSPDTVWERWLNDQGNLSEISWQSVPSASTDSESWFDPLKSVGSGASLRDLAAAQPGKWVGKNDVQLCAMCRQGNSFTPLLYLRSGANVGMDDGAYLLDLSSATLTVDGVEVPASTDAAGLPSYTLPDGEHRYELTTEIGSSDTTWDFRSSPPTREVTLPAADCVDTYLGASDDPCAPIDLPFLNYDGNISGDNTIAPGRHQLAVSPYHLADDAPAVTSLKVWTSVDHGATWTPAAVKRGKSGSWTATYAIPRSGDALSIKAVATDEAGSSITQTMHDVVDVSGHGGEE